MKMRVGNGLTSIFQVPKFSAGNPLLNWHTGLFDGIICTGQFKDAHKTGHEVTTKLSKAKVRRA